MFHNFTGPCDLNPCEEAGSCYERPEGFASDFFCICPAHRAGDTCELRKKSLLI